MKNQVIRRVREYHQTMKIINEAAVLNVGFRKVLNPKGNDIRAVNIALVSLAAESLQNMPPDLRLDMQERFLKSYCKAANAPFTFYKLGE